MTLPPGRITAAIVIAVVVVFGALALGGVPLLGGLATMVVVGMLVLPAGPRQYLLKRAFKVVLTIFVAMAVIWFLVHNYPDASRDTPTGVVPAMERYIDWLADVPFGEFGDSTFSETVGEGVSRTIPISTQLMIYSQIIAVAIAVPGALYGARFRGRGIDLGFRALGFLGLAVPIFVIGPIFQYALGVGDIDLLGMHFGVKIFPVGRYIPVGKGVVEHLQSMALPCITLGVTTAAAYMVLLRSEILAQLPSEHVMLARSKGVPPARIVRVHALRPAAPSAVAAIAAQSSLLFGNLVIIERIFILPGFGDYVLTAIGRRDDLAVVGALFVIATILALVNLFADAILLAIDPRIET